MTSSLLHVLKGLPELEHAFGRALHGSSQALAGPLRIFRSEVATEDQTLCLPGADGAQRAEKAIPRFFEDVSSIWIEQHPEAGAILDPVGNGPSPVLSIAIDVRS